MNITRIIFFFFGFSLFMTAMNAAGIFDAQMPADKNLTVSTATIEELTDTNTAEPSGFFDSLTSAGRAVSSVLSIMKGAVSSILNVDDLLVDYGFPSWAVTMLFSMIVLLAIFGLARVILERRT